MFFAPAEMLLSSKSATAVSGEYPKALSDSMSASGRGSAMSQSPVSGGTFADSRAVGNSAIPSWLQRKSSSYIDVRESDLERRHPSATNRLDRTTTGG